MQRHCKLREAFIILFQTLLRVAFHFEKSPTVMLSQHNSISWHEAAFVAIVQRFCVQVWASQYFIMSSRVVVPEHVLWIISEVMCEKFQIMPSKESMNSLYPFLFSFWLKVNMIAGAGAAILGQETEPQLRMTEQLETACVPDTIQLPYINSPAHLNCQVRENKVLYYLSLCVLVFFFFFFHYSSLSRFYLI